MNTMMVVKMMNSFKAFSIVMAMVLPLGNSFFWLDETTTLSPETEASPALPFDLIPPKVEVTTRDWLFDLQNPFPITTTPTAYYTLENNWNAEPLQEKTKYTMRNFHSKKFTTPSIPVTPTPSTPPTTIFPHIKVDEGGPLLSSLGQIIHDFVAKSSSQNSSILGVSLNLELTKDQFVEHVNITLTSSHKRVYYDPNEESSGETPVPIEGDLTTAPVVIIIPETTTATTVTTTTTTTTSTTTEKPTTVVAVVQKEEPPTPEALAQRRVTSIVTGILVVIVLVILVVSIRLMVIRVRKIRQKNSRRSVNDDQIKQSYPTFV